GLARIGHQEVAVSHANLFGTDIRDDLVSFVLPLSADRAAAADWYHSGFDDGVLGFSENRVTLGAGLKLRRWLWAGASGKLLARGPSLDGLSIPSGRGFGLDLGLLAVPAERWHLALVGQDLTGTSVGSSDGESVEAYPRNLRFAAAYAWPGHGAAAFDLDDRWHLGVEATPHPPPALPAGLEQDRSGSGSPARASGLRLQRARRPA